jgi:hypothetical protein
MKYMLRHVRKKMIYLCTDKCLDSGERNNNRSHFLTFFTYKSPCLFSLSAISQQYFSLGTNQSSNQLPATNIFLLKQISTRHQLNKQSPTRCQMSFWSSEHVSFTLLIQLNKITHFLYNGKKISIRSSSDAYIHSPNLYHYMISFE